MREYEVGRQLRERYNEFLGDLYYPEIVDARSSDLDRTKMSLELVLAGLFPPTGFQTWNPKLPAWQPIPCHYLPINQDMELVGFGCPSYKEELNRVIASEEVKAEFEKYRHIIDYLAENTGQNYTSFIDTVILHLSLTAQAEFGLKLPKWTDAVYPIITEELTIKGYLTGASTDLLKRLGAGYLAKKIIQDTQEKINEEPSKHSKKVYLYSGHEQTVAYLLSFLGIYEPPHIPAYGSHIILEIHEKDGEYGVKVLYQDDSPRLHNYITLPGCEEFCPLDKFMEMHKGLLPADTSECGYE
ncbi:unnamed protein product [Acanthoscelides obtectus]|uniref:acid phosphatase n=1 Tax=Acanthoscelides obtectus TaxID=200917 RepID=A0A9P0JVA0_ACAOB|nr:unnamed protein product [Acanthoscelides obtectus]CAK1661752.1 hypothetical protein AOBTE_LOCUS22774 [Acanthoscelides obtectus]